MNPLQANRRRLLTISNLCCLLVSVFVGLVCPLNSASAAMITSGQSMTSGQVLVAIEGSQTQLGALTAWFDIGLSDPYAPTETGFSSRAVKSFSGDVRAGVSSLDRNPLVVMALPNMEWCVFAISSLDTGSSSALSSNGFTSGHGNSIVAAILVPQTRFPVPVLNHFWRGTEFVSIPPVFPDDLLRPPQI